MAAGSRHFFDTSRFAISHVSSLNTASAHSSAHKHATDYGLVDMISDKQNTKTQRFDYSLLQLMLTNKCKAFGLCADSVVPLHRSKP